MLFCDILVFWRRFGTSDGFPNVISASCAGSGASALSYLLEPESTLLCVSKGRLIPSTGHALNIERLENRLGTLRRSKSNKSVWRVLVLRTTASCKSKSCSNFLIAHETMPGGCKERNCNQCFTFNVLILEIILNLLQTFLGL